MAEFGGKKIHMIGIKGVGMTALAELLFNLGAKITGSDVGEEFHTDEVLKRLNVKPLNFDSGNVRQDTDLVVYSSAYAEDHPERKKARELGILQMSYAEALADIFNKKRGIMVAGSHGKTTTTALLGQIMISAGLNPTVVVGGTVVGWNSNFRAGSSEWIAVEGDEYQEKFLNFKPEYLIITNIDYDHPDTFPDIASYRAAFEKLKNQTRGKIFDLETVKPLNPETFKLFNSDYLVGEHNRQNSGLVFALARELGITDEDIKRGVSDFRGVHRRMEIYFNKNGLIIIDDYAHHPTEISATLKAAKERWPDYKITAIFQPHTFSRTKALMPEFARAFKDADEVYLAPTYSSAREKKDGTENLDSLLLNALKDNHSAVKPFSDLPAVEAGWEEVWGREKEGNKQIIITMGAGDLWLFAKKLANFKE